jgi:preprotein translocase subunit SecF
MKLLKLVPDNTNIRFLRWRVPFYVISLLLMAASVTLVVTKGLNLGVDFVGGQSIRVEFSEQTAPVAQVREEIDALGYGEPIIQQVGRPNQITIRMKLPEASEEGLAERMVRDMRQTLEQHHPGVEIGSARAVSGKVSDELFRSGMIALALAMIGISIYIWVRFEWQFGIGALFALAHDVTLTLGMFALTGMEFDLNIVAAILTLIGYSLNDTIVVYDRIREEMARFKGKPLPEIINIAVNDTLSRTILTSGVTALSLVGLLIFGVGEIWDFAMAMLVGIIVGTYSSVYIASPLTLWLDERAARKKAHGSAMKVRPA